MPLTRQSAHAKDLRTAAENPLMQHRHFAAIAHTIATLGNGMTGDELPRAQRRFTAHRFADALAQSNPRFDRGRFLAACGLPQEDR